ncbi:Hypothetical predicted protein, partial [Scomber scombrus]
MAEDCGREKFFGVITGVSSPDPPRVGSPHRRVQSAGEQLTRVLLVALSSRPASPHSLLLAILRPHRRFQSA